MIKMFENEQSRMFVVGNRRVNKNLMANVQNRFVNRYLDFLELASKCQSKKNIQNKVNQQATE